MSRIRTIKPEFWGHQKVSKVSRDARLLFLGLLNESDDEGKLLGSAKRLAGIVFPYDDDVTAKKIDRWLDELANVCLIFRYEVDDAPYIWLPGFLEHQKISHPTPSRLPNPSGMDLELFSPEGNREQGGARTRGSRIPEVFEVTPEMKEWVGLECPGLDWSRHTTRFVNYWKAASGRNAVKLDWERTWRNWMLKEQDG